MHRLAEFGLPLEGSLDVGGELLVLLALPLDLVGLELGHHIVGEQLERLADVLVLVVSALLNEDGLIDA